MRSECWWCSETGKASPVGGGRKRVQTWEGEPTAHCHITLLAGTRAQPLSTRPLRSIWIAGLLDRFEKPKPREAVAQLWCAQRISLLFLWVPLGATYTYYM